MREAVLNIQRGVVFVPQLIRYTQQMTAPATCCYGGLGFILGELPGKNLLD